MSTKSTNRDLSLELSNIDQCGELRPLIINCLQNKYHCFKSKEIAPKMLLVDDLQKASVVLNRKELKDIRKRVISGEFDEKPDESDKRKISKWLDEDNAPDIMYDILGIDKIE